MSSLTLGQYAPTVIGGVGGSGTRLPAKILTYLGYFMGSDLNKAHDNLWITLLFKRVETLSLTEKEFDALLDIFLNAMLKGALFSKNQLHSISSLAGEKRLQHSTAWLRQRADSLLSAAQKPKTMPVLWGWKEPNTHIIMDRLAKKFPAMKYIHVIRNGLDMAHSGNQNQLEFWGSFFLGEKIQLSPCFSLKYWRIVHEKIFEIGKSMGPRFLLLNYDQLCREPEKGLQKLLQFLETQISPSKFAYILKLARPPKSIGRFKQYALDIFDREDVAFVKNLGFETSL